MTIQLVGATEAAKSLNEFFPEVRWDRFVREDSGAHESLMPYELPIYTIYGWIDREDSYKDLVWVTFTWDGSFTYYTTSAKYSLVFHERINGTADGHTECERVEDWFPEIKNVVRINKEKK